MFAKEQQKGAKLELSNASRQFEPDPLDPKDARERIYDKADSKDALKGRYERAIVECSASETEERKLYETFGEALKAEGYIFKQESDPAGKKARLIVTIDHPVVKDSPIFPSCVN